MYPSLKEFKEMSREFERVVVYKEMDGDMDTPVSLLAKFLPFERAILLESAKQNKTYSRFSFLAFDIVEKLVVRDDGVYVNGERQCPSPGSAPCSNRTACPPIASSVTSAAGT